MKKTFLALVFCLGLFFGTFGNTQTVEAQYTWGNVFVSSNYVEARIQNNFPWSIWCSGRVWGIDRWGNWVTSWVDTNVPPYSTRVVYVYATGGAWFIQGDARINCRW